MESAGPMTRSKARAVGKAATPALQETTNASKSTRKTTTKKNAASAPAPESPLRRTALLDDFNNAQQVDVTTTDTAQPEMATASAATTPIPSTTLLAESTPIGSTIAAKPCDGMPAATPASHMTGLSFGVNPAHTPQESTPELFAGFQSVAPTPSLADMLNTPNEASPMPSGSAIPGLSPVNPMSGFLATPASATNMDLGNIEQEAPPTKPVEVSPVMSFFKSPEPTSAVSSEQAWVPAEQMSFQPMPEAAVQADAASPFITTRQKATETNQKAAATPAAAGMMASPVAGLTFAAPTPVAEMMMMSPTPAADITMMPQSPAPEMMMTSPASSEMMPAPSPAAMLAMASPAPAQITFPAPTPAPTPVTAHKSAGVTMASPAPVANAAFSTEHFVAQAEQDMGEREYERELLQEEEGPTADEMDMEAQMEEEAHLPSPATTPMPVTTKGKAAKSVAFHTPATGNAADKGRTPLMSQLSGAGHTPWAKPDPSSVAFKRAGSAPPVPKFTPATTKSTAGTTASKTDAAKASTTAAAPKAAAPSAKASSPTGTAGNWSFLKPTAASQARAAKGPAAAPAPAAAEKPRLKSKVVVPEHSTVDPRSLTSLRKEVKKQMETKASKAPVAQAAPASSAYTSDVVRAEVLKYKARKAELKAGGAKVEKKGELERAEQLVQEQQEEAWQEDEEWDENDEGYYDQEAEDALVEGMEQLDIRKLRGLPTPAGKHTRFDDDGEAMEEEAQEGAAEGVLKLKGLPTPKGKHIVFDE